VGGASGRGCGGRSLWTKEGRGGGQGGGTDEPLHPAPNAPAPTHTQEGDPEGWWEESFNGHSDSKPRGPQAISLDLAFPGAQHVYGLPERATNLALGATKGECGARAPGSLPLSDAGWRRAARAACAPGMAVGVCMHLLI